MKLIWSFILSVILLAFVSVWCATATRAQENQPTRLILSKDASGNISRTALTLTLRANPTCDQTGVAFPDGSQLIATDLSFITDENNLGLVYGTVQLSAPAGQGLQTMILRGTFGMNTRREAKRDCRFEHLEAMLEPVPTFAPVNAPQIALAHLSADIIPEAAGPLPVYHAKLDGVVTLPQTMNNNVTINPAKNTYDNSEAITVVIANNTNQAVSTYDLKSYCSIVRLQRQGGENWEDIGECLIKRMSFLVTLGAGETQRVVLNANELRKPGAYRLVFDYILGTGPETSSAGTQIVSPTFSVNPAVTKQEVKLQFEPVPELVGQEFVARVSNDTDWPIQAEDHQSECSILHLQQLIDAQWTNVALCRSLTPTRRIKIEPRQSHTVKFQSAGGPAYAPGTYRLALVYQTLDSKGEPQDKSWLHSAEFVLQERK